MIRLIRRRVLETAVLSLLLSLLIFGLFAAVPGDYLSEMELNPVIPASQIQRMRSDFGLDQPFHIQYFKWLGRIVRADFGYSFAQRRPATSLIAERAANTLALAGVARWSFRWGSPCLWRSSLLFISTGGRITCAGLCPSAGCLCRRYSLPFSFSISPF